MADGLCGPSNALQNFQKHSTVDRTLQQDRLISRQSPSQGFRSSPGPNAGLLDPEFEAFQAGHLPLESHQSPFQQFSHSPAPSLQHPGADPSAAWASDFQRLHVSSPLPQAQQAQFNPAQLKQNTGGWHQDFVQQFQGEQRGMAQPQMNGGFGGQFSPMSRGMAMGVSLQPQFTGGMVGLQSQQVQQQPVEAFDDEAFARAFEDAAQAEMAKEELSQPQEQNGVEIEESTQLAESAEDFTSSATLPENPSPSEQIRIGADLIHDPSDPSHPQTEDPDALARTAGRLLESVRSNTSEKFQKSQFLQLMRQFRDREMVVEGDKIVGRNTDADGMARVGE